MNLYVLATGVMLVFIQGLFANADGYLTQKQMVSRKKTSNVNGYSFMEHGGMWADVFIVSPVVAWITGKYVLAYTSWWALSAIPICVTFIIIAGRGYRASSYRTPEAHCHHGKTTAAGWVHGIYALAAMCVLTLFYFDPHATNGDLVIVSVVLSPFFFIGSAKWNARWFASWKNDRFAQVQAVVGPIMLWIIVLVRYVIGR